MFKQRYLIAIIVAGIAMSSQAAAEPQHVTTVEGIAEFRLENGLRILLFPDPSKPRVTVNLTVFVGSRHEGYGEAGMAHLLEHMLFKGTPDHPEVPKVLKEHGAEFNGTTWLDRTNYYETLPASEENLEFAIRLEADRMVNSYVKKEDLDKEMTVVRNEFERGENSPSRVLMQKMFSVAYDWHNYGKATIGNRADIERVPIESLRKFYRKYYQPDNAMLIVAGQFDPAAALGFIQKYFGAIPAPERELPNTYTEEPAQDGERLVRLHRVGDVALCGALYHICSGAHPDYVSLDVLEHILTSSPSGRLYEALVKTKRAASVSGAAYALHDPGVLRVMAEVNSGNDPEDVLATLLEVMETIGEQGVTQEEVERAKLYWLKTWEMSFNDTARLAIQLSEWAAQGDWRLMFLYRDRLEQVSPESVQDVARRYLTSSNRTAGLFLPTESAERAVIPATPNLAEMIGDYQGRAGIAAGEAFDVSPENIDRRTVTATLPTGLNVAFLPKKTRGEAVTLRLTLRYGNTENLKGLTTACEVMPALMLRGTKSLDRQQIQDALNRYRAKLTPNGNTGEATFQLQTRREYLTQALDLLRQVLREPTLPSEELEILRAANISRLEQRLTDPTALAQVAISRRINPYDPDDVRYVPTVEEEIDRWKNLSRAEVGRLYSEYLSGQHGQLSIVGDFDPDEIRPVVERLLTDWTTTTEYQRIVRRGDVSVSAEHIVIETPDKENATYLAGTVFPISDHSDDYAPLLMGNYILGSSGLASRLGDRVRQKEGLSYGVGSFVRASSLDPRMTMLVYAITNPVNMSKVETAIAEEMERLLEQGITQAELDAAREGYLENQIVERAEDTRLASLLNKNLLAGRSMSYYADLESRLNRLTVDDVNRALKKWVDLKKFAIAVAGDFANKVPKSDPADPKDAP